MYLSERSNIYLSGDGRQPNRTGGWNQKAKDLFKYMLKIIWRSKLHIVKLPCGSSDNKEVPCRHNPRICDRYYIQAPHKIKNTTNFYSYPLSSLVCVNVSIVTEIIFCFLAHHNNSPRFPCGRKTRIYLD